MKQDTSKELNVLGNGTAEKGRYAIELMNVTKLYAEVTDGKILIRHKFSSPAIKVELKDKESVLINPKAITGHEISLVIDDNQMRGKVKEHQGEMVINHLKEIEYPDTNSVLEETKTLPSVIKIKLSKKLLKKFLKSLPDDKCDGDAITFEFKSPNKAVYFHNTTIEGLILPML